MYRATWAEHHHGVAMSQYQFPRHKLFSGYGRVICLFKCKILGTSMSLAFIEVYYVMPRDAWAPPASSVHECMSILQEHGNLTLYAGSPARIYEIIPVDHILGPVPIMRNPVWTTIPHGMLDVNLEHGRADSRDGMGNGSGHKWTCIGMQAPQKGRYRSDASSSCKLVAALRKGTTEFTTKQWNALGRHGGLAMLRHDDYVKAGNRYYIPGSDGSELYTVNWWTLTKGAYPGWLTAENVGLFEPTEYPFTNFQDAVAYIKALGLGDEHFVMFKLDYQNAKANCNPTESGKFFEAKNRVFELVQTKDIVLICALGLERPDGVPPWGAKIIGLTKCAVLPGCNEEALSKAWRQWRNMNREDYDKGWQKMERHKRGFAAGRGVLYKNLQAIDVEKANLYFVPRDDGTRDVGVKGGTVYEEGERGVWRKVTRVSAETD
jgi:hypothetical protein